MGTVGGSAGKLQRRRAHRGARVALTFALRTVPLRFPARPALVALVALTLPAVLPAQRVLGPGDDAWTLPGGVARIGLSMRFLMGDEWYNARGTREPLGALLSRSSVDASSFPGLAPLESSLRTASGLDGFRVGLGAVSADLRRQVQVVPLEASLGITDRLTLRVMAPLVAAEQQTAWQLDPSAATVGSNPALVGSASRAQNAALLGGLSGSADALEALIDDCTAGGSSDPRCASIVSDLAAVRGLVTSTRTLSEALAATYGGRAADDGAMLVPLSGTAGHDGVLAAVAALRERYTAFGDLAFSRTLAPVGAEAPPTIEELHALLLDGSGAYALGPWERRYQQGFGDIDVGLWWRLFDGAGADPWTRLGARGPLLRQTIGVTYRVGNGIPFDPDDPLLIGTGDGQDDLELTSATDVLWGAHLWSSVVVRYTKQFADERVARLPDPLLSPYLPLRRRVLAERALGDRITVDVAPRWVFNDYLAVGARYRLVREAGATWRELDPAADAARLTASTPTTMVHEAALGFTWSSVAAWQRGRTRTPIELSYERATVFAGDGEVVRMRSDRLGATVYAKLWGK
jgi:hypothetical protein